MSGTRSAAASLPPFVRELFWDYAAGAVRWDCDRDLIMGRVLSAGTWDAVQWLRRQVGDEELRAWIEASEGRCLSPQQLRYWQHILDLPSRKVDRWLRSERRSVWDRRAAP